jgi:crossover junction endodeoxyribonuclease RuvC
MTIMGIDPGTARIGWGVISSTAGTIKAISYGLIETHKDELPQMRLLTISHAMDSIIEKYHPDAIAVEELFFTKNVTTAISVGQARGVILLSGAKKNISITSYSPRNIKSTITGTGGAEKKQIQFMVAKLLRLPEPPKPDDVADALAIALTHAFSYKMKAAGQ